MTELPRVVLVTGGSGGLGGAIVALLRERGAEVAFTYHRNEANAHRLAVESGARCWPLDLQDPVATDRLVREVEAALGVIDGLVNAFGIRVDALAPLTSNDDWQRVVDTNLGGVFRCCRAVIPGMIRARRGAIVNLASLSALHGRAGQGAYAASKAGVLGLTRVLAREVGRRGIRVNAVAPGYVLSALTESLPESVVADLRSNEALPSGVSSRCVAESVAFLLSSRAESITGECVAVDAGASA